MSTVYLTNRGFRWRQGQPVPFNLRPAEKYGKLHVVFENGDPHDLQRLISTMERYTVDDYLVLGGDLELVVWAAAVAMHVAGTVTLLKWHNRLSDYQPIVSPTLKEIARCAKS